MGVPADAEAFNQYTMAVSKAIKLHHQSRVAHIDLYPSTILWNLDDISGRIVVCIVDWDSATFIDDTFMHKMLRVFSLEDENLHYWKLSGHAEPECDAWFLF
jgi:serine/threonine protein kinase